MENRTLKPKRELAGAGKKSILPVRFCMGNFILPVAILIGILKVKNNIRVP